MTKLILLSYGRDMEYRRAIFAALSFWSWYRGPQAEVQTVILTDNAAFFEPYLMGLPVRYELLTKDSLAAMQKPHGYVHRVKGVILQQLAAAQPDDSLLFFDSDTFFISSPDAFVKQLAAGTTFMHKREYTLAEAVEIYAAFNQAHFPKKLLELLATRTFKIGGAERQFAPTDYSWNSGVLGLPPRAAALLPDTLRLMDDLYSSTGWFTSEQIAFSLVLPTLGQLLSSDQYVFHYWGQRQKVLMDDLLEAFVAKSLSCVPLPQRLAQVRQQVPKWQSYIELDRLREGALYSLKQGELIAGLKYAAKAWLAAPLSGAFAKDVWQILR
jgi:hypothetical protein